MICASIHSESGAVMAGNRRANKARNQIGAGNKRGVDNAPWLKNNTDRARRRRKISKASRRKNR